MIIYPIQLMLADDDEDDCLLFKEALGELALTIHLTTVNDGQQLMEHLVQKTELPDVLFLDLNMPRKNGFECLTEIRANVKFTSLPVIIFSTSFDHDMINLLYSNGAQYYIRKPADFSKLKEIIQSALALVLQKFTAQPLKEKFILNHK